MPPLPFYVSGWKFGQGIGREYTSKPAHSVQDGGGAITQNPACTARPFGVAKFQPFAWAYAN